MTTLPRDRRQFGRRNTCLHAWIKITGRPQLPCIVRNLSAHGALLEFKVPDCMPYAFRLRIEATRFETDCELRHMGPNGCGVMFVEHAADVAGSGDRRVMEADAWVGRGELVVRRSDP